MNPLLDNSDWEEVFKYAKVGCNNDHQPLITALGVSAIGFAREDVVRVISMIDGSNNRKKWIGMFKLEDGRFVCVKAKCDHTGWGGQESGSVVIADSEYNVILSSLNRDERERLGIKIYRDHDGDPTSYEIKDRLVWLTNQKPRAILDRESRE